MTELSKYSSAKLLKNMDRVSVFSFLLTEMMYFFLYHSPLHKSWAASPNVRRFGMGSGRDHTGQW